MKDDAKYILGIVVIVVFVAAIVILPTLPDGITGEATKKKKVKKPKYTTIVPGQGIIVEQISRGGRRTPPVYRISVEPLTGEATKKKKVKRSKYTTIVPGQGIIVEQIGRGGRKDYPVYRISIEPPCKTGLFFDGFCWDEKAPHGATSTFPDTHKFNPSTKKYEAIQVSSTGSDRGVRPLIISHQFSAGETLDFDVYYNSGSGNHMMKTSINNNPNHLARIGYWNGALESTQTGTHHWTVKFLSDGVISTIKRPDKTVYTSSKFTAKPPYDWAFTVKSGHNGAYNYALNNFK